MLNTHKLLFNLCFTIMLIALIGCASKPVVKSDTLTLSTARFGHAAVNDGDKIYVFAGANEKGFLSDIEIIDPISNSTQNLDGILIPRRYFSAVWDGKHSIYILGGVSVENNKFRYESRVEVFDTKTQTVSFADPMPAPTRINTAVYLDGKIIVLGGAYPKSRKIVSSPMTTVYDTARGKWIRAADMPSAKATRAVAKDGFVYVVGGYNRKSAMQVFERFDPKTNEWISLPPMPMKISAHSLEVINNKLYTFGNYDDLSATYSYDFTHQIWEKVDIGYQASRHNAVTTLNGKTYVIGGNTGGNGPFLDSIQVFKLQ